MLERSKSSRAEQIMLLRIYVMIKSSAVWPSSDKYRSNSCSPWIRMAHTHSHTHLHTRTHTRSHTPTHTHTDYIYIERMELGNEMGKVLCEQPNAEPLHRSPTRGVGPGGGRFLSAQGRARQHPGKERSRFCTRPHFLFLTPPD